MKSHLILFTTLCVLSPLASAATTVFPTGAYPADVDHVRAAITLGGLVVLKATNAAGAPTAFNFGPPVEGSGSIELTRDVRITGDSFCGKAVTTIHGGSQVFSSLKPIRSEIRGIVFDGPQYAAFFVSATNGAEFSHNRVSNIVGRSLDAANPDLFSSQAVRVTGAVSDMHGRIAIEDNVIENSLGNLGHGIALFSNVAARVRIARNVIRGVTSVGILVGWNTEDVTIEDNLVVPGPASSTFDPDRSIPLGIQAGPSLGGAYVIRRNRVRCENPLAEGITLFSTEDTEVGPAVAISHAVVERNDVTMHNSEFGGISLYGSIEHSLIAENRISGDGALAINCSTSGVLDTDLVDSNRFRCNDISHFSSTQADVFFDINTLDNVFIGATGNLVDLGTGNQFSSACPRPCSR